jgi:hypothetical protein
MHIRPFLPIALAAILSLGGCVTPEMKQKKAARQIMEDAIRQEAPGNYFVGRRYYKKDYKFWGYVRKPGEQWNTAKLVMLNEQSKLAPDRELGTLGSDNNSEYKLYGEFSGQTVYEPASNGFYPEFNLKAYELRSVAPANIFKEAGAIDPARRIIATPY